MPPRRESIEPRAVIYARYSSDLQRDASIEDQIRLCRGQIDKEGWQYIEAYTDRASSGASTLRPAYQALLEDARRGGFDIVVAEALDRLSRDQEDVAGLLKRLRFASVRLVTVAEGEIGELHVGLKGTMNALFLKDLADKTRRGLEGRVREGRSGGGLCFGYDVVRELDGRGEPIHGGRRINEPEAAIVRRIFAEFAGGKSPRRIAVDLNRDGVPGPRGGEWDASTVNGNASRGTGILNNGLYIGRLVWNRLRYVKDPATGKRISRLNEPDRWIVQEVSELGIIAQDLWDRVKERQQGLKRNTRPDLDDKPFWERHRPRFLITGLAKCGACGSSYVKISANLFGCAAARNRGTCDNRLNIRLDTLEEMVLGGLRERLMAPELFKAFCEEFHREVNRQRADKNAAAETKRSELDKVERRIRRIVELITDDDAPVRALKQELVTLEARQDTLRHELANSTAPAPLLHPTLAEVYRQQVEQLHGALQNPATRDEAFELVRSLIDEIRLVPVEGELRVELKGELAGILALAADSKKPGDLSAAGLAEQIKMVAGTRNHLYRTSIAWQRAAPANAAPFS
jgi:DNA invertase Pin-like site-specific DNA recombinase